MRMHMHVYYEGYYYVISRIARVHAYVCAISSNACVYVCLTRARRYLGDYYLVRPTGLTEGKAIALPKC